LLENFTFCSAQIALLGRILPLLFADFMALLLELRLFFWTAVKKQKEKYYKPHVIEFFSTKKEEIILGQ